MAEASAPKFDVDDDIDEGVVPDEEVAGSEVVVGFRSPLVNFSRISRRLLGSDRRDPVNALRSEIGPPEDDVIQPSRIDCNVGGYQRELASMSCAPQIKTYRIWIHNFQLASPSSIGCT